MNQPLEVDWHFYHPHCSCFIQPKMGLKVAINGITGHPPTKSLINHYLKNMYSDGSGDPVVCDSCVELDSMVYCTILHMPHIASCFVSKPFTLFAASGIKASPPQYLYALNMQGIPITAFNPNFSSQSQESNPLFQQQLDNLTTNANSVNITLQQVIQQQNNAEDHYQHDCTNLIDAFKQYFLMPLRFLQECLNSARFQQIPVDSSRFQWNSSIPAGIALEFRVFSAFIKS